MNVLALDTALGACSVAIYSQGVQRARQFAELQRGHAEALMDMVAAAEAEAGLSVSQMNRLAVTVGPGTFTGLRVGLSAARGMALAAEVPLVGITTLQAMAKAASQKTEWSNSTFAVVIDARRGELYVQLFDRTACPLEEPQALARQAAMELIERRAKQDAGPVGVIGSGGSIVKEGLSQEYAHILDGAAQPDAHHVAILAAALEDVEQAPATPLYLRAPDAKLPTKKPLSS